MEYNKKINYLRGFGIVLVVLGHSFPTDDFNNNYFYEFIHKFIYSFHMPLFFWISGFCAISIYKVKSRNDIKEFYKKKLNRLIVPYCAITLLAVPIKLILNKFSQRPLIIAELIKDILIYPVNSPVIYLWYIYALFLMFLLLPIVIKFPPKIMIIILVLLCTISPNTTNFLAISSLLKNYIFFYLGLLSYGKFERLKVNNIVTILLFLLLVVVNIFFNNIIAFLVTSSIGILLIINIIQRINNENAIKSLDILAYYSYDIYLFSWFFMTGFRVIFYQILNVNYGTVILILFISGFMSILLSKYIIRKNKYLERIFLGRYN
ncbi:acyltransferase family protein [Clostridium sp.]|uniref:acyltransferase family protein n=1 Tax=Clostridium sp. TaxID=1506 RepID=UPI00283C6231|nr:acyltransferase family protein [Clostridium sp.]MDR3594803.1 acyltransferase family protein [Clostridium sp.]